MKESEESDEGTGGTVILDKSVVITTGVLTILPGTKIFVNERTIPIFIVVTVNGRLIAEGTQDNYIFPHCSL